MFFATSCKLALLALAVLSASLAEAQDCQAIGSLTGEITIKRNGAKVGYTKRDPCTGDKNFGITSQLPYLFIWSAHCNKNTFKDCKGAYASETNLLGNPSPDTQCFINFKC